MITALALYMMIQYVLLVDKSPAKKRTGEAFRMSGWDGKGYFIIIFLPDSIVKFKTAFHKRI